MDACDSVDEFDVAESVDICLEATYGCVDREDCFCEDGLDMMRRLTEGCVLEVKTMLDMKDLSL